MAKVKTIRFTKTGPTGERLEFSSDVAVDGDGIFSITVPDELAESGGALSRSDEYKGQVFITKARTNWRVSGRDLGKCDLFVRAAIDNHLAATVTRELVILYTYSAMVTFARASDGSIHPNGTYAGPGAQWAGNRNIHAHTAPREFSVGLAARVVEKVTHTRPTGSKVVYERATGGSSHFEDHPINRLNGWIVHIDTNAAHEMPYSVPAAEFFNRMMTAMCQLGAQIEDFLSDRERLQLAIERGAGLLPAPAKSATP